MALDERYTLGAPLNQYFVDKDTGEPLATGELRFYRDSSRATQKAVYQLTGAPPNYTYTSVGAIITLSAVGTIQNSGGDNIALYLYPYDANGDLDLYYVECWSEGGVLQWTREAWPNLGAGNDPALDKSLVPNQVSNPQFTEIFLNESVSTTITNASGTNRYPIAPDWDLEISSAASASVVVQRIPLTPAADVPSRAPYALQIDAQAGITECLLVQRKSNNLGLWTSSTDREVFLSGSMTATNANAGSIDIELKYRESSGVNNTTPVTIIDASFTDAEYTEATGASVAIPTSTSTDTGRDAYIELYAELPLNSTSIITSIQVIPAFAADILAYDSRTADRERALMGDFYLPALERRTAKSLLQGWDFPLNPRQFQNTAITSAPTYIIDQTIAQSVTAGGMTYADYEAAGLNLLQVTSVDATDALFMTQYLSGQDVKSLLGNRLSMNISAWASTADVVARVYLVRGSAAANFPTLPADLGTFAADGTFTLVEANWSIIARNGLGTPQATLNTQAAATNIADYRNDVQFSQWEIVADAELNDTDKFACIVSFEMPTAATVLTVNSISLTQGDIASRPQLQTDDEALKGCQKFYQKSYRDGVLAGTASVPDMIVGRSGTNNNASPNAQGSWNLYANHEFAVEMVDVPTIAIWDSAATTANSQHSYVNDAGLEAVYAWPGTAARPGQSVAASLTVQIASQANVSTKSFGSFVITIDSDTALGGYLFPAQGATVHFHFEADARLGL